MDNKTDEIIKAVTTAAILGSLMAAVRAFLATGETLMQKIRTFFAGLFMSVFMGYILMDTRLDNFYKGVFIGASAAFISTVWPILERIARAWVTKKGKDAVSNSDDNKLDG